MVCWITVLGDFTATQPLVGRVILSGMIFAGKRLARVAGYASQNRGGVDLNGLVIAVVVLLSVLLSLAAGIGLSFLAVSSVLRAFGHRPQKQQARLTTAPVGGN